MRRIAILSTIIAFGSCADDSCPAWGCIGDLTKQLGKGLLDAAAKVNSEDFQNVIKVGSAIYNAHQEVAEKKTRVDEGVTITIPRDVFETRDKVHYYSIKVSPKNQSESWTVLRRYNCFRNLMDVLGPVSDSFVDAPFPGRVLMALSTEEVEERRRALELWLNKVVDHIDSRGPWYWELRNFLEPAKLTATRNQVIVTLPAAQSTTKYGTHFFGISATPKNGEPWLVHRRFNEFLELKTSLGAQVESFANAPFPGKVWFMDESKREERRNALEIWLQTVLAHADSLTVWAPIVRDFLDPEFDARLKQTKTLVAQRAKEREDEDIEELAVDAATDALFNKIGGDTVLDGVKEALIKSMEGAVEICSAGGGFLNDSTIKIDLPGELGAVAGAARKLGLGAVVDQFVGSIVASMNDAASKSVPKAVGVFKDLIRQMKITDLKNIWMSKKMDACTRYLKRTSKEDLKSKMLSVCHDVLDENALMKTWHQFVEQVKPVPIFGAIVAQYDIQHYVVEKALDGLFRKMAIEEEKIRRDPWAQSSSLLESVFGSLLK